MKRLLACLLAAGLATAAYAAPIPAQGPVLLVDGDTIKIDGITIRLLDIDTPETWKPRCDREYVLGLDAKQRLRQLLDSGPVSYEPNGIDRYGRVLAHVYVGSTDVSAVLLSEGFALPYVPGKAAKLDRLRHWCGS